MIFLYENFNSKIFNVRCVFFLLLYFSAVNVYAGAGQDDIEKFINKNSLDGLVNIAENCILMEESVEKLSFTCASGKLNKLNSVFLENKLGFLWSDNEYSTEYRDKRASSKGCNKRDEYVAVIICLFKKYKESNNDNFLNDSSSKICLSIIDALVSLLSLDQLKGFSEYVKNNSKEKESQQDKFSSLMTKKLAPSKLSVESSTGKLTYCFCFGDGLYYIKVTAAGESVGAAYRDESPRKVMRLPSFNGDLLGACDMQNEHIKDIMKGKECLEKSSEQTDMMICLYEDDVNFDITIGLTEKGVDSFNVSSYNDEGLILISAKSPTEKISTIEYFFKRLRSKTISRDFKASSCKTSGSSSGEIHPFSAISVNESVRNTIYRERGLDISKNMLNFISLLVHCTYGRQSRQSFIEDQNVADGQAVRSDHGNKDSLSPSNMRHACADSSKVSDNCHSVGVECEDTITTVLESLRIYLFFVRECKDEEFMDMACERKMLNLWDELNGKNK